MRNHPLAAALVAHLALPFLAGAACAPTTPAEVPTVDLSKPAPAPAPPPAAAVPSTVTELRVDPTASRISFMMEAPREKIRGEIRGLGGTLRIDPTDLTRTTGTVTADLDRLELFHARADLQGVFGDEEKTDIQNRHARAWLEIGEDAPADVRARNRRVELSITGVDVVGGGVKAAGDLLIHGVKHRKTAELDVKLEMEHGAVVRVSVRTTRPFAVGLAEYDIAPRDAFGKLAMKSLEVLSPRVAAEAMASVELTARAARRE